MKNRNVMRTRRTFGLLALLGLLAVTLLLWGDDHALRSVAGAVRTRLSTIMSTENVMASSDLRGPLSRPELDQVFPAQAETALFALG